MEKHPAKSVIHKIEEKSATMRIFSFLTRKKEEKTFFEFSLYKMKKKEYNSSDKLLGG